MTLKVYLKSKRKPIEFEFDKSSIVDKFYEDLMTKDIIKLGQVVFRRDEFQYAVVIIGS